MSYALITGASKGIGRSLAIALAKRKTDILLVSRSADLLKELAESLKNQYSVKVDYLATDLSLPDAADKVSNWVADKGYPVNVLINNAGYGLWGRFDTLTLEQQNNMLQLNVGTVVNLCHKFLPLLRKSPKAYILNVSSTAAYQAVPTLSLYAASKSFILLFSRGLKYELKDSNVSVSVLSPGPTSTEFVNRAGMNDAIRKKAEKFNMSPDEVAEIALSGMFRRKTEIIPGAMNSFLSKITSFAPKTLTERIAAGLYETD